jgi:hypothetical protein
MSKSDDTRGVPNHQGPQSGLEKAAGTTPGFFERGHLSEEEILVSTHEAARMLLCKPQTLRVRRLRGGKDSLPYVRLGKSRRARVAYRLSDLKAYLAAHVYTNTAEETVCEDPEDGE